MDQDIHPREYIDKKLLQRVRMLVVILVIMSGVLVYEVFISQIHFLWVIAGLLFGIGIGFIAGRMFSIEWHRKKKKVIGRLDAIGIVVLILYITFSIARHWIFEEWFKGAVLSAFTFSFIEGAMLGRIISFRANIRKVLSEQNKL